MKTTELIIQFAESEGGSFRKRDFMSQMAGTKVSPSYISLALSRMVKAGTLTIGERGQYCISEGKTKEFVPNLDTLSRKIASFFREELPFTRYCLYEGEWLNPFMHHIAGNRLHCLEVERDVMNSVFDLLSAKGYLVFLHPDRDFMYRYVDIHNDKAIIIKPLISESPVIHIDGICCPTLEKIIVDISKDPDFDYLQGLEYLRVLHNIREKFRINVPKLLRYAARRNVREEMVKALEESEYDLD